ncbi:MAG: C10 family peptidase [Deltaproteobacteria bacterium]|nr:C10 family peptidase [Deltaproteobacteria bacterium]
MAILILSATLLFAASAWPRPTTPEQARAMVGNWLGLEAKPMGASLGAQIREVQTFPDSSGSPAYYVVYLNPSGLVFVPADDLVEPLIGFLPHGVYDPSPNNPLGALVSRDIPGRVLKAREIETQALAAGTPLVPESPWTVAQQKWARLANPADGLDSPGAGYPPPSDVRVAPFTLSRWSQTTVNSQACYNYYNPPNGAGNAGNYPCGCTATAMAQVLYWFQYPAAPVVGTFTIKVNDVSQPATIRGGDGSGGPYDWANMVADPLHSEVSPNQAAAIGALTYDAGVSVKMSYTANSSTAWAYGYAFVNTFKYANAKLSYPGSHFPDASRNAMINANLHAQYPVIVDILNTSTSGGHAVVCDGYGYNSGTMYNHLNMGWAGSSDAWYNLPNVLTYDSVYGLTYNIFVSGTGEIIAGRVTDGTNPLSGATVTASRSGGGTYSTTTNANGLYALVHVPSASSYSVNVAPRAGFTFTPQSVSTLTSTDYTATTGNVWGVDFKGTRNKALTSIYELLLQ